MPKQDSEAGQNRSGSSPTLNPGGEVTNKPFISIGLPVCAGRTTAAGGRDWVGKVPAKEPLVGLGSGLSRS